ncbi:hypothetical protein [Leptolyngbya sp. PCC 6406]|uniref:hypothetical protein n=1 Tax=Leptolyngbya sp. PCC 6406 TaxID=1173264 RepID=UPI0002AC0627|nr:hypothetical protein [Leptolyngbya sp. PCC 6406]
MAYFIMNSLVAFFVSASNPNSMRRRWHWGRWIIAGILGVGLLGLPTVTLANAPPPQPLTWFTFDPVPAPLTAVQIIGCEGDACEAPEVLAQYGDCTARECLAPVPPQRNEFTNTYTNELTCRGNTCLWSNHLVVQTPEDPQGLRLLVQSGDRHWVSNVAPVLTSPEVRWNDHYWQVTLTDNALRLDWDEEPGYRRKHPLGDRLFFQRLLLTLVAEGLVLGMGLWRLKGDRPLWIRTWVCFGLMHCVTYPLVWTLPWSLMPFQLLVARLLGISWVAIAVIYAACLYPLRRRATWQLLAVTAGIPILFFLGLIISFLFSYGQRVPISAGLPYGLTLGITEILITGYEAGFLALLSRGRLSLKVAGGLSVAMNSFSLVLGLVW